jgi:hypothetical protein
MAICPFASVRLLNPVFGGTLAIVRHNRINLHVAGGYGSLFSFFNQTGRASSHFWVAKSGLIEQYQDTDRRAEADLQGNDATVSIETESKGEPWTPEQLASIIQLVLWILATHPTIPPQLAQNSQVGPTSWGLSWHRLGIDGNFPAAPSRYAGRRQLGGGMYYSKATGKVCPVEGPIDQIHDNIFPAIGGAVIVDRPITPPPPPPPPYVPPPTPPPLAVREDGWFGSETINEIQRQAGTPVDGELWYQYSGNKQPAFTTGWVYNYTKGKGSPAWAWVQGRLGTPQDGVFGQTDLAAMEHRAGYPYDKVLGGPSNTVKWFQHALNTHTL